MPSRILYPQSDLNVFTNPQVATEGLPNPANWSEAAGKMRDTTSGILALPIRQVGSSFSQCPLTFKQKSAGILSALAPAATSRRGEAATPYHS